MTNKELLVLAALAAKYDVVEDLDAELPFTVKEDDEYFTWNPIDSSADAFDLAVDLGLVVSVNLSHTSVGGWSEVGDAIYVEHGDDKHAATRLAIVMAAAEVIKLGTE